MGLNEIKNAVKTSSNERKRREFEEKLEIHHMERKPKEYDEKWAKQLKDYETPWHSVTR